MLYSFSDYWPSAMRIYWSVKISGLGLDIMRLPARWASCSLATASNVSSGFIYVYMWWCNILEIVAQFINMD